MKGNNPYFILIILSLLMGTLLFFSACVSQHGNNQTISPTENLSSPGVTTTFTSLDQDNWIQINPVSKDNTVNSAINENGQIWVNVSGTTNYSPGTLFVIQFFDDIHSRNLDSANIEGNPFCIVSGVNGTNTFNCTFGFDVSSSSKYRVEIHPFIRGQDGYAIANYTGTMWFNVTSKRQTPFIFINSVSWKQPDQLLNISGTTSVPVGTEVTVFSGLMVHPCATGGPSDSGKMQSWCGGNCDSDITKCSTVVTGDSAGENTWSCLVNSTGWCTREMYFVRATVTFGNETVQDYEEFSFTG